MPPTAATHEPARQILFAAAHDHQSDAAVPKCKTLFTLVDTCRLLENGLQRDLAHSEITENGFLLLSLLIREEPNTFTPSEMADQLHLGRPIVSTTLGRLEVSGLIRRERSTTDLRSLTVRITDKGRQVFASATAECVKSINRLMAEISAQELAQLDATCSRLRQHFLDNKAL